MKRYFLLLISVFLLSQCGFIKKKNQNEPVSEPVQTVKTQEEIQAIEKARADSIENAEYNLMQKTAFGNLIFGMPKTQAETANEKRQLLGKYSYNFQNLFNGNDELYAVILNSDGEKAIAFDSGLKAKYNNLYKIIETKYGKSTEKREYPSIFEVQEVGNYWVDKWELGNKQIHLGIKENALNSYSVASKIFDKKMEDDEAKRLNDLKNKDVIQASEKF